MAAPIDSPGVVVLGMHRSGTSAVTHVVNLLGASLGDPDDLYAAHDNPQGHWESTALIECNDRILARLGGGWAAPPYLPSGWDARVASDELLTQMADTFTRVYARAQPLWLWKDPRTCLTLPLWRRVLRNMSVLLVLRHPDDVVSSIERRDGFTSRYALRLWETYTRAALTGASGLPTVVVRYEDMAADPAAGVDLLVARLRALGVSLNGDPADAVASFHASAVKSRPAGLAPRQRRLLAELETLAPASAEFAPPDLPRMPWVTRRHGFGRLARPWGLNRRSAPPARGAG